MDFIEAVVRIAVSSEFKFCGDEKERNGLWPLCVYKDNEFSGKLRWPKNGKPASVDDELATALLNSKP